LPAVDKTGPEGEGPLTGRGLGPCRDDKDKKSRKRKIFRGRPRRGRRLGLGRGLGRGARRGRRGRIRALSSDDLI